MTGTTPAVIPLHFENFETRAEFFRVLFEHNEALAVSLRHPTANPADVLAGIPSCEWADYCRRRRRRWRSVRVEALLAAWRAWAEERGIEVAEPEESFEVRSAFLRWLYDCEYEKPTPTGELARRIHRVDSLGYHVLRNHAAHGWPRALAKRGWQDKIDVELLLEVFREWKKSNGGDRDVAQ